MLTLLATGLVLAHLLLWSVLPPTGPRLAAALGGTLLVLLPALVGRQPSITVACEKNRLQIRQQPQSLSVSVRAIERHEQVEAQAYHRHWRRYAGTRTFVNHIPDRVLLLHTSDGPIAVGLALPDQQRLLDQLATTRHDAARPVAKTLEP